MDKRLYREQQQARKERHQESSSQKHEDSIQPKFGSLIPVRNCNNTSDELRQFAKNVLGDYDSTMQTIQNDCGHHISKLYGVERTQPITPITSTSSFNIFDSGMKEKMNTTAERRDPIVAAEGRTPFPTFGDRSKGSKQSPPSQSSNFKYPDRNKPISRGGKFRPVKQRNYPLSSGISSSSLTEMATTHSGKHDPSSTTDHAPSKPSKKSGKKKHLLFNKSEDASQVVEGKSNTSLSNIGKSSSFVSSGSSSGATSPSHSEKGVPHSTPRNFKRSSSADTPLQSHYAQPTYTSQTGYTSLSCSNSEKKGKKPKKVKREKEQHETTGLSKHKNQPQDSLVTGGDLETYSADHVTPVLTSDMMKSNLSLTSLIPIEESTSDTTDLQTMLKEMHSEMETLPSFLTPIHTPGLKQESPFVFTNQPLKSLPSIKEESSLVLDNSSSVHTIGSANLSSLVTTKSAVPTQNLTTEDLIGSVSSSDSSSSDSSSSDSGDSSSDEDDEDEEKVVTKQVDGRTREEVPNVLSIAKEGTRMVDDSTTFMLDQIHQQCNQSLSTLTPIKSSPLLPGTLPFPLTDESANLSPAKFVRSGTNLSLVNQPTEVITATNDLNAQLETSRGFSTSIKTSSLQPPVSISDSDSSSSGEESDSESSDSEDETFISKPQTSQEHNDSHVNLSERSLRQESKPFHFEFEDISQDAESNLPPMILQEPSDPLNNNGSKLNQRESKSSRLANKRKKANDAGGSLVNKSPRLGSESSTGSVESGQKEDSTRKNPLVVHIPLWKVSEIQQKTKPQAKVEPYCVSSNRKRTSSSADSIDLPTPRRERHEPQDGRYSRRENSEGLYDSDNRHHHHHHHGDNGRSHNSRRWHGEYEGRPHRRGDVDSERSQGDHRGERNYHRSSSPSGTRDDYWDYRGSGDSRTTSRDRRSHGNSLEYYYERARTLKREADAITGHGTNKAIKYMHSVTFFMRHGFAQENDVKWDGNTANSSCISKAFKIYSDTLNLLKYSMKLGSDCKPLLANCLRCHGVLLWKMYSLKQRSVIQHHKDLLEVFNPSKLSQKSPNPSSAASFSPLPSPASVGSTNSSCSGVASAYSSIQEQNIPVSKAICNKVNEYLAITGYVHQGIDLWKQAESMSEQYRDIFSSADKRVGHVTQFSPVAQIADWIEDSLHTISSK